MIDRKQRLVPSKTSGGNYSARTCSCQERNEVALMAVAMVDAVVVACFQENEPTWQDTFFTM